MKIRIIKAPNEVVGDNEIQGYSPEIQHDTNLLIPQKMNPATVSWRRQTVEKLQKETTTMKERQSLQLGASDIISQQNSSEKNLMAK